MMNSILNTPEGLRDTALDIMREVCVPGCNCASGIHSSQEEITMDFNLHTGDVRILKTGGNEILTLTRQNTVKIRTREFFTTDDVAEYRRYLGETVFQNGVEALVP